MQFNAVDFPEPVGPITEKIVARSTSKETLSSAVSPPKRIVSPSTAKKAI